MTYPAENNINVSAVMCNMLTEPDYQNGPQHRIYLAENMKHFAAA